MTTTPTQGATLPSGRQPSLAAQARGRFGEDEAARWYVRQGYRVIARNWRCEHGEIDLIVSQPSAVVFCEVKARATGEFGGPQGAVNWAKQRRLRRLAAVWLAQHHPGDVEVRFDVAAVVGARVEVLMAAF
jgi:putative endonuclease